MNKIILIITIFPWLLYTIYLSKNNLIKLKENHYLLSNFSIMNIISIKNILLFLVYIIIITIYKSSNQINLVSKLLFSTINLFLFIYTYYEYNNYDLSLTTKDKLIIVITTIITSITIIISLCIQNNTYTYSILFAYSILNIIILYISNKISHIVRRISNEKKQL